MNNELNWIPYRKKIDPRNQNKRNYKWKDLRDWSKDHCDSTPMLYCEGLSYPMKEKASIEMDDLIWENQPDSF
jgi:hypothetical protein